MKKVTVSEAAQRLGLTQDAVRKRLRRGSLACIREEGTVLVLLPDDTEAAPVPDADPAALRARLTGQQERIALLEHTVARLWQLVSDQEEARRQDREVMKAQLVNQQLLLREMAGMKQIAAGPLSPEARPAEGDHAWWQHHRIYPIR